MSHINDRLFTPEVIAEYKKQFNEHKLRRVVIDDFLKPDIAESIFEHFPDESQMRRHYKGLNEQKSEGSSFDQYHPHFEEVRQSIMDEKWTKVLDEITGFTGLVLPDDFRGAGVHQGFDGSFLDIHVDFNIHPVLDLHRRLNLLIYMNKDWKPEYKGYLELWNEDVSECIDEIAPSFNRCVIFETNEVSYHGYDKMDLPEGVTRKSIFSYYYTPIAERSKVKYHDTIFKPRPSDTTIKKAQTAVKEGAKNFIKKGLHKIGAKKFFKKFE
ncbi:MAG: 2OG-Fe(II) oxygenase [Chitinophagales bacterium]